MEKSTRQLACSTEPWQLDRSGFFVAPPYFLKEQHRFFAAVTTKAAGNMQEEAARVKIARRLDLDARHIAVSYQAHEKQIHVIRKIEDVPLHRANGIDGWASGRVSGATLGVFGADCLGVFLVEPEQSLGALLHVGWRGLERGVVEEGLGALVRNFGAEPSRLVAAIGPHIRSCCYEVQDDVAGRFPAQWLSVREGKKYLNIEKGVADKLTQAGIAEIHISADCTRCSDPSMFFSYRRQDKGSQLALLAFL